MNKKEYVSEEQSLGLGESVTVGFGDVWKVAELSPRGLVTTSGRLGITDLNVLMATLISDFGPRTVDWTVTLHGTIVKILHPDDSITTP